MFDVSVIKCNSYDSAEVKKALTEALDAVGGLSWIKSGMKIAIKANLVSFIAPDKAATTHPALLCELVKMIVEKVIKQYQLYSFRKTIITTKN